MSRCLKPFLHANWWYENEDMRNSLTAPLEGPLQSSNLCLAASLTSQHGEMRRSCFSKPNMSKCCLAGLEGQLAARPQAGEGGQAEGDRQAGWSHAASICHCLVCKEPECVSGASGGNQGGAGDFPYLCKISTIKSLPL